MSKDKPINVPASIHARLLEQVKNERIGTYNEYFQYFVMERFLYRLSCSQYRNKFILKGAMLFRVWNCLRFRSTADIDLLGFHTSNSPENIVRIIREILAVPVEEDGLSFDLDSIRENLIAKVAQYNGITIRIVGKFGNQRINIHLDIGFGDSVYPEPEERSLQSVLNFNEPMLLCYTKENVVAEKYEAMISHGFLNSRMKDFYDLVFFSEHFNFEGKMLQEAIRKTFQSRDTVIELASVPFSDEFIRSKEVPWRNFLKRGPLDSQSTDFRFIISTIRSFLMPAIEKLVSKMSLNKQWSCVEKRWIDY